MKHTNSGLFFQNGEKVQESRGSYANFFRYDNLMKLTSTISKVINQKMKEWRGKDYVKIDRQK